MGVAKNRQSPGKIEMAKIEDELTDDLRIYQRFGIERTLRAVANGKLHLGRITKVSVFSAAISPSGSVPGGRYLNYLGYRGSGVIFRPRRQPTL